MCRPKLEFGKICRLFPQIMSYIGGEIAEGSVEALGQKYLIALFIIVSLCSTAVASPKTVAISAFSSSNWLSTDSNTKACELLDDFLINRYGVILFDGSKTSDKKEMARRIGKSEDYVISLQLTGFYDPPHTTTHIGPSIKPEDTVAMVLIDYSVYLVSQNRWVTGRVDHRIIYPGKNVPLGNAYTEAVKQALPKLATKLDEIVQ